MGSTSERILNVNTLKSTSTAISFEDNSGTQQTLADTSLGGNIGSVPVGTIVAWFGGVFTGSGNTNFLKVLGETVSEANAYLPSSWKVCDGSELYDTESPLFNQTSRYLPDLTDSRFLSGSTSLGNIGGSNSLLDHTHTLGTLAINSSGSHTHIQDSHTHIQNAHTHVQSAHDHLQSPHGHSVYDPGHVHVENYRISTTVTTSGPLESTGTYGNSPTITAAATTGISIYNTTAVVQASTATNQNTTATNQSTTATNQSSTHSHSNSDFSGNIGTGSSATLTENRPKYLTTFFIIRIK